MLKELHVRNYALIDELTTDFSDNLTILSGETGAGKSIIVGALGLVLGEKARTSSIRSGAESCTVEGRFELERTHPVHAVLMSRGMADEASPGEATPGEASNIDRATLDMSLVIRRVVTRAGTSKCFINGFQVSVRDLQEITSLLIDIHGQHQHQSLLAVRNHLILLDKYGKLEADLAAYQKSYKSMIRIRERIVALTVDEREKERRMDILRYSIEEIEKTALQEGEEEELDQEYKILKNYEKLLSAVSATHTLLKAGDMSAITQLEQAVQELQRIHTISPEAASGVKDLESAKILVEECAYTLQNYIESISYEPGRIDRILTRLEQVKTLKKKYGETVSEIEAYRKKCEEELESLESNEEAIGQLEKAWQAEQEKARRAAIELSARRRVAAKTLEESVMKELSFLSMAKARFKVQIIYSERTAGSGADEPTVSIDGRDYNLLAAGLDKVEFLISTNTGEPLLPLKNVASGGELSRIMLAIKTVLGDVDPIRTFVFDEIDAGIGGKVAWAVGNRLKELSTMKQILCITHQAQIASRASLNLRVDKENRNGRTVTSIRKLGNEERVAEVARMISGKTISEAALKQAHEMISEGA
jgi:DNA repair protein RecN (Recombination protein N)